MGSRYLPALQKARDQVISSPRTCSAPVAGLLWVGEADRVRRDRRERPRLRGREGEDQCVRGDHQLSAPLMVRVAAISIWLWHKDRDVVTDSYGVPGTLVIAIP
jgi:hypothetical protein